MKRRIQLGYAGYVISYFFFYFCMAVFNSIIAIYLGGLQKSSTEISFIVSSANLFSFILVPITGYIHDRFHNTKVLSITLILLAGLFGMLFSLSRNVLALFFLNGMVMACINCVYPITERIAASSQYRYGAIRVWGSLGYAAGAQAAGLAMEYISSSSIFIFLLVSSILTAFGLSTIDYSQARPEKPPATSVLPEAGKKEKPPLRRMLCSKNFILYLLIVFLFFGASTLNMTYLPVLLNSHGIPASAVGTILFFSTVIEIPILLFSHIYMDRFPLKHLLWACCGISILQYTCYGLSSSRILIVLIAVSLKAVATTLFAMINLKAARCIIDKQYTTTALSFVNSSSSLGAILLQNAGGLIIDRIGLAPMYLILASLVLLAACLAIFLTFRSTESVFS